MYTQSHSKATTYLRFCLPTYKSNLKGGDKMMHLLPLGYLSFGSNMLDMSQIKLSINGI